MDRETRRRFALWSIISGLGGTLLWWLADVAMVVSRSDSTLPKVLTSGWFSMPADIALHIGQHGVLFFLWALPIAVIMWCVGYRDKRRRRRGNRRGHRRGQG